MHSSGGLRDQKRAAMTVFMSLAMLLAACTAGSSASASPDGASGSERASPTNAPRTPVPSSPVATPAPSADVTTVTIRDRSFGTPEITVAVGDVTFINADELPHTVTEGENGDTAPNARVDVFIDVGESAQVTFGEADDYLITCLFHPEMSLLVHAH